MRSPTDRRSRRRRRAGPARSTFCMRMAGRPERRTAPPARHDSATVTPTVTASRLRVQHRRLFGSEERRQHARRPSREQQSERRAADRDREALEQRPGGRAWPGWRRARASPPARAARAALRDSSRLPALTQALTSSSPVDPSTTVLISRTWERADGVEPRVGGAPTSVAARRASVRVPRLVSGMLARPAARRARSRFGSGVVEASTIVQPADHGQVAIAARAFRRAGTPAGSTTSSARPSCRPLKPAGATPAMT